jgi:hypothetical protein
MLKAPAGRYTITGSGMINMKRHLLITALTLLCVIVARLVDAAEVSEERDIAMFGISTGRISVPPDVLTYAESSIGNEFVKLKRFNVLGYEAYRLEAEDVEEFIERVRGLQAEKAKEVGTYDEKFGTVVISGEDFDRIVGSVLIVIPTFTDYRETVTQIPIFSGDDFLYYTRSHNVNVAIDLTFLSVRTGSREEAIRLFGSGQDQDLNRATREAVDNAVSNLSFRLRQVEAFKIRSGVVRVQGDRVFFELGSDIGVRPGHEYEVLTKEEVGNTGRITQIPTGLVRVRKAYPELSEAQIVYRQEPITEGDQLVEVARWGMGVVLYGGAAQLDIPDMNYSLILVGDATPADQYYSMRFNQEERAWAPAIGVSIEKSLGYRFQGIADVSAIPGGTLWGFLGEFGVGMRFSKRRFDLQVKALPGFMYMTSFSRKLKQGGSATTLVVDGVPFDIDKDPTMNVYGFAFGAKLGTFFNYRIGPGSSLRLGVNYRAYTPINNWKIDIRETTGNNKNEITISSDSSNIFEGYGSQGLKRVSITGLEFSGGFTFLF